MKEVMYNRKQAAEYLGVSVITLDRAIAGKKISCYRIGRRILFSIFHLQEFLKRNEVSAKQR